MNITHDNSKQTVDKPEIEQVVREQKEFSILGTYALTKGLSLFAYNSLTGKIRRITLKRGDFIQCELVKFGDNKIEWVYFDPENYNTTIDSKEIYFESLNLEKAEKRVEKFKQGRIEELFNLKKPSKSTINIFEPIS